MTDSPLAMTVRDVAAYLNVNEKTVYRLAQRCELPGFKVAGAWRSGSGRAPRTSTRAPRSRAKSKVAGVGTIRFEVNQEPENPWNALVGVNLGAGERLDLSFEYGFNFDDVTVLTGVATFRF